MPLGCALKFFIFSLVIFCFFKEHLWCMGQKTYLCRHSTIIVPSTSSSCTSSPFRQFLRLLISRYSKLVFCLNTYLEVMPLSASNAFCNERRYGQRCRPAASQVTTFWPHSDHFLTSKQSDTTLKMITWRQDMMQEIWKSLTEMEICRAKLHFQAISEEKYPGSDLKFHYRFCFPD